MKILCVIDSLGPGGAQRQLVELAIGFKEKANEVSFLTYHNNQFFIPILEKYEIKINCINEPNYIKRLIKIRSFIRRGNFNAVLSFLEGANFICEFAGIPFRKWRLIVGERSADRRILKSMKLLMYRWFHIFADCIVANSKSNLKIIRSANPFLSKAKCRVIYNSIDFNHWKPLSDFEYRKNGKLKLVISSNHIYIKNLNGLIEALALMNRKDIDKLEIEWYGARIIEPYVDNSFPEAKQKINKLELDKIISFHAPTNEITQKIQTADSVGLFSFIEGLPNAVCEGMACAKPIICSRVSDIPDLLLFDKRLLFDPYDPVSIKDAISYLLSLTNDELCEIGLENQKVAKRLLNKSDIISSYLKLLTA